MFKIAYHDPLCTKQLLHFSKWLYFFIYLCQKIEISKKNFEILISVYSEPKSSDVQRRWIYPKYYFKPLRKALYTSTHDNDNIF